MYRQLFNPRENGQTIPAGIPSKWNGLTVEVIAFPIQERRIRRDDIALASLASPEGSNIRS
ncbi:MAG: hypothetical protein LBD28_08080 [Tannerellaceae bacterium]|jgi:hypothetical protein|nr:hypothetical protein [Tannerellaceae bacterium]